MFLVACAAWGASVAQTIDFDDLRQINGIFLYFVILRPHLEDTINFNIFATCKEAVYSKN